MVAGIIVSLVLTLVLYLGFPIFYLKKYGKVERKKAKKIAIINWIVCYVVILIIGSAISGAQAGAVTSLPNLCAGWLYYSINVKMLTKEEWLSKWNGVPLQKTRSDKSVTLTDEEKDTEAVKNEDEK